MNKKLLIKHVNGTLYIYIYSYTISNLNFYMMKVKGGLGRGAVKIAASKGNAIQSFIAVAKEEGIASFWKGNLPQVKNTIKMF